MKIAMRVSANRRRRRRRRKKIRRMLRGNEEDLTKLGKRKKK